MILQLVVMTKIQYGFQEIQCMVVIQTIMEIKFLNQQMVV